jgi:hypothetical protein
MTIACYGGTVLLSLLVCIAALKSSHGLSFTDPVVLAFTLLLLLPAIITAVAPAAGLGLVLAVSLISWAVPALLPQLSSLGPETTFGIAVLTAWIGLLAHAFLRRVRLLPTPFLVPLLAWNAWALISFVWNRQYAGVDHSTLYTVFLLIDTAFFVFAANAVRTESALRRVLLTLVFTSIPLSVIAYLQYAGRYLGVNYAAIHPGLEALASNLSYAVRVAGTLSDATLFSFYYLVIFVLAAAFLVIEQRRGLRLALALTIAFDIWPFMVTFTKSTIIAILLALFVFAWLRRSWKIAITSALVSAASWLALTYIPFTAFLAKQGVNAAQGQDAADRWTVMKQCAGLAPHYAIFGSGPLGATRFTSSHCHDLPLELLLDYGLPGTLLFGWFAWVVAKRSWQALSINVGPMQRALAQANMVLLLGFAVLALLWPLTNYPLAWYWGVVAVLLGGGVYQQARATSPGAGAQPASVEADSQQREGRTRVSIGERTVSERNATEPAGRSSEG